MFNNIDLKEEYDDLFIEDTKETPEKEPLLNRYENVNIFQEFLKNIKVEPYKEPLEYFNDNRFKVSCTGADYKEEIKLLNTECDLPTFKTEDVNFSDEPRSSSQFKKTLSIKKQKKHPCSILQKSFPIPQKLLLKKHFWKPWLACAFCGHFYAYKFEYFTHYFNHTVKINTIRSLNFKTKQTSLKTYEQRNKQRIKKSYICIKKPKESEKKSLILHTEQKIYNCNKYRKQCLQKLNLIKKFKMHKCEICLKQFTRKSYLNYHLKIHTVENLFKCEICLKQFKNKQNLKLHLRIHTGDKSFKCEICLNQFTRKTYLNYHLKIHTGENLFKCEICLKQFTRKSYLKYHLKIHTGEKSFKCEICLKQFSESSNLNRHLKIHLKQHLRIHTGEKPFSCEICLKQFKQRRYLTKHLKVHTGEKPFKCETCLKQFKEKENLKQHLRIHTGEKPFICAICLKQFTQKSYLNHHLKIHTGENLYRCDICLKQFAWKSNLNVHLKVHTGENQFKCGICFKQFTTKQSLKRHLRIHTVQNNSYINVL